MDRTEWDRKGEDQTGLKGQGKDRDSDIDSDSDSDSNRDKRRDRGRDRDRIWLGTEARTGPEQDTTGLD